MKARRIYFPALSLLVTFCACLVPLFWFSVMVAAGISPLPHPHWLTVCLRNSGAFGRAALAGTGITVLGSVLTLWLILKTEASVTAHLHLKNIGMGVLFGAVGGLLLGGFSIGIAFLQAFQTPGGLNRPGVMAELAKMALIGLPLFAVSFGVLCLVGMAVPYALFTLISRARQPSLLTQTTG